MGRNRTKRGIRESPERAATTGQAKASAINDSKVVSAGDSVDVCKDVACDDTHGTGGVCGCACSMHELDGRDDVLDHTNDVLDGHTNDVLDHINDASLENVSGSVEPASLITSTDHIQSAAASTDLQPQLITPAKQTPTDKNLLISSPVSTQISASADPIPTPTQQSIATTTTTTTTTTITTTLEKSLTMLDHLALEKQPSQQSVVLPPLTKPQPFTVNEHARARAQSLMDLLSLLPVESRDAIYMHAGLLTAYMHGRLAMPVTLAMFKLIVADSFHTDLVPQARANLAPKVHLSYEPLFVHSPNMKQFLLRFPRDYAVHTLTSLDIKADIGGTCLDHALTLAQNYASLASDPNLGMHYIRTANLLAMHLFKKLNFKTHATTGYGGKLFEFAAGIGRLDIIKQLVGRVNTRPLAGIVSAASRSGFYHIVRFLCDNRLVSPVALDGAVEGGHVRILKYLYPKRVSTANSANTANVSTGASASAASVMVNPKSVELALKNGHTATVQWILDTERASGTLFHQTQTDTFKSLALLCATYGHFELLKYAVSNRVGDAPDASVTDAAAAHGHFEIVAWLVGVAGCGFTNAAIDGAAALGRLDMIKYLDKHGAPHSEHAIVNASAGGHLDVVKWVQTKGVVSVTEDAIAAASGEGRFAVLLHLCSDPTSRRIITNRVIGAAARSGHIETFKHLWNAADVRPAEWDIKSAITAGHFWIVEWTLSRSLGDGRDASGLLPYALMNGHLFIAQWIVSQGRAIPSASMMDANARHRFPDCDRWMCGPILVRRFDAGDCNPPSSVKAGRGTGVGGAAAADGAGTATSSVFGFLSRRFGIK